MRRPNLTDESAGERVWMPKYPTERMAQAVFAEAREHHPPEGAREIARYVMALYPAMVRAEGESEFLAGASE